MAPENSAGLSNSFTSTLPLVSCVCGSLLTLVTVLIGPKRSARDEQLKWWKHKRVDELVQWEKVNGISFIYHGQEQTQGLFNQNVLILVFEEPHGEWWWPAVLQSHQGLSKDRQLRWQDEGFSLRKDFPGSDNIRCFLPVMEGSLERE